MTNPNYPYGDPGNTGGNPGGNPGGNNPGNPGGTPDYGSYGSTGGAGGGEQFSGGYPGTGAAQDPYGTNYGGGFENSPMNVKKNKLAGWALGLGIASIVVFLTVFTGPLAVLILAAPFIAVAGLIVSIVALIRGKNYQGSNKRTGWSVGGLILSIISLIIVAFFTILVVLFLNSGIMDCFTENSTTATQQACVEQFMNENF